MKLESKLLCLVFGEITNERKTVKKENVTYDMT